MPKDLILPTQTEQLESRIALLEQQVLELQREVYTARRDRDENYKRWWAMVEKFDPESNTLEDMIEEIFQLSPELKPEIRYTISKELRV
tara:strand:+ start:2092 stop:2358 length:267 start_codon:yes stop_codon:yes gene_type:complete